MRRRHMSGGRELPRRACTSVGLLRGIDRYATVTRPLRELRGWLVGWLGGRQEIGIGAVTDLLTAPAGRDLVTTDLL